MKSFFRFILLALVLLVVALVAALTAMRFAIHGREVAVPDLVGKTPTEAFRAAGDSGLQIEIERKYYSAAVLEGRILSQLPLAGTQVRRGWQVRVAQSLGPQRVEIPSVLGQSARAAEINILRRGLEMGAIAHVQVPELPGDQVISQSPPPNASGVSAPKVSLLVTETSPPEVFVMPNFIGQPLGSVTLALRDAGLHLGTVAVSPQFGQSTSATSTIITSPASMIVSQNPAGGDKVAAGAAVNFEVR
jgi:beta-lactam-binding protein with PASTA domain